MNDETMIEQLEANASHLKNDLNFFVAAYREACGALVARLPTEPTSERQKRMIEINGTPRSYAQDLINGVGPNDGNLSHAEAVETIKRYEKFWHDRA